MKKYRALLLSLTLAFSLPSCTVTGGGTGGKEYIAPVATITTTTLIARAKTPTDRSKYAVTLVKVADALESLTGEDASAGDIAAIVQQYAGNRPEWVGYGAALGMIFDRNKHRIGVDVRIVLSDIAAGIKAGADPYLVPF